MQQQELKDKLREILNSNGIEEFNEYIENISIYVAGNLKEAWLMARPDDYIKFKNDSNLQRRVLRANGKWLEPTKEYPEYAVIIASGNLNKEEMFTTYLHELTHVKCFIESLEGKKFDFTAPAPCKSFADWSEFHAVYNATLLELLLKQKNNSYDNFKMHSELLGYKTADALHGIINANSKNAEQYFLARYLGAQRAIRDFAVNYTKVQSPVFHIWNMTPTYITEKYGYVFYLANKWQLEKKHGLYDDNDWKLFARK